MTRVAPSMLQAVAGIGDGATVLIRGCGVSGMSVSPIDTVIVQGEVMLQALDVVADSRPFASNQWHHRIDRGVA